MARLLRLAIAAPGPILEHEKAARNRLAFADWTVLREVGGEIEEIFAFAVKEEVDVDQPLLIGGRFENGLLFEVVLLPNSQAASWSLELNGATGQARLEFSQGWMGPAHALWVTGGDTRKEAWDEWSPWAALAEAFNRTLAAGAPPAPSTDGTNQPVDVRCGSQRHPWSGPTWQDAIRSVELDDAARRSLERRRASTLEFPEATEEAGFKGTMTLVGCGLLWAMLVLLILSRWQPVLGWIILPLLIVFLALQLLRWVVPRPKNQPPSAD
jgi:hypothetical protein